MLEEQAEANNVTVDAFSPKRNKGGNIINEVSDLAINNSGNNIINKFFKFDNKRRQKQSNKKRRKIDNKQRRKQFKRSNCE